MRKIHNFSERRQAAVFFLFVITALLLLFYPLDRLVLQIKFGWHNIVGQQFAMDGVVWVACMACLVWMWRIASLSSTNLPLVFTRYSLFLLVLFFAMERFIGIALSVFHPAPLPHRMAWIQLLSAIPLAVGVMAVFSELRNMKESAMLVQKEHARFLASVESSLDDFYIFDGIADASGEIVDFRFSYINPNAERRLNTRREKLLGKILTEVRPYMMTSGLIEKYKEVVRTGVPLACEVFIDDERIKATWLNIQVVKLGSGIAITSRDVTESKLMVDHVQHLAHHDQLTGLANRTLLQDRLHQAVLRARRYRHRVAFFVLDIDHFKQINDSLGHADGDALLVVMGERLMSSVRETDTVARMGGDEFVIVMPDFKNIEDVRRCGFEIVKNAAQSAVIGEREIHITVSVGVCIFPDFAQEEEELYRNADAAMYVIKDRGRNGIHFFGEDTAKKDDVAKIELEKDRS
ncbi:diguanylate cyclase domain-containing protein [Edaphobacter albus]|uniref:diguanylate cyclase domain-containing protein n=1 Tax=Edaphobacter sp. 4G125 TaxID=2763071 RepID=UPI001644B400|nr:diguanylate cyclase [Edaphobacter sp. 4G125]QNI37370.1 diguanylate cyclase [Edaphobacter sp. 4G125]